MKSMHALAGALLALTLACQPGPDDADDANADTAPAAAPVAEVEPSVEPPADADRPAAAPAPAAAATPQAAAAPQGEVVYLDVRTPAEFAAGHVKGAVLVPHDQVGARLAELEQYRDRDLVVYCRSGRRSAIAIDVLKANGFTRLTNGGGFDDLKQRVPVE
jgi:phage shock protein E